MKNILLLGATGSIGDSVLSVIKQNSDELNLVGIAFQSNTTKAISIIEEFDPNYAYCESKANLNIINDSLKKSEVFKLTPFRKYPISAFVLLSIEHLIMW